MDKVRTQRAGISALVDVWWQTVRHDVTQLAMTPRWTQWAADVWLPLMSGQAQLRHTRHPVHKAQVALVLQTVEEACERHPRTQQRTPEVLAGWQAWAAEHARAFQRASSAGEGRNGSRAQMQHNQRGLPPRRYPVWTVLHNFGSWPLLSCARAPPLRECAWQTLFDKPLAGTMDRGEAHTQSCRDFFVRGAFGGLEQHVGACYFTRGWFPLLHESA